MNRRPGQYGFTLIEVAAVLVLAAMLAAVVVVSSRGMTAGVTAEEAIAQIESIDLQARRHARQTGHPVQITIDTHDGSLLLSQEDQSDSPIAGYRLPRGYSMPKAWVWRGGQREERSQLVVHYDARGTSDDWGMSLKGSDQGAADFLFMAGATGQLIQLESDEQARDILAQVRRRDAH